MLVIHILSIVYTFDTCEKVSEVYRSVGCCTGNGNIFGRFITPGINVSEKPSIIASEGGWTGKDAYAFYIQRKNETNVSWLQAQEDIFHNYEADILHAHNISELPIATSHDYAVIFGGSRGIGAEMVKILGEKNFKVEIVSRDQAMFDSYKLSSSLSHKDYEEEMTKHSVTKHFPVMFGKTMINYDEYNLNFETLDVRNKSSVDKYLFNLAEKYNDKPPKYILFTPATGGSLYDTDCDLSIKNTPNSWSRFEKQLSNDFCVQFYGMKYVLDAFVNVFDINALKNSTFHVISSMLAYMGPSVAPLVGYGAVQSAYGSSYTASQFLEANHGVSMYNAAKSAQKAFYSNWNAIGLNFGLSYLYRIATFINLSGNIKPTFNGTHWTHSYNDILNYYISDGTDSTIPASPYLIALYIADSFVTKKIHTYPASAPSRAAIWQYSTIGGEDASKPRFGYDINIADAACQAVINPELIYQLAGEAIGLVTGGYAFSTGAGFNYIN